MLYALDSSGRLIEPAPKAVGTCTLCKLPLIPKCGQLNIWHWSHRAGDCDPWNEGETDWHRAWKRRADPSWCEVVLAPHRAEIRRPDGLVIELQHSSISSYDIAAREAFYGNMWWLFHRDRFGKKARFFITEDGRVRLRWLNGSRTLPLVTKPIFADLGGPIVELTGRLDGAGGWGRLLTLSEFLAKAELQSLRAEELATHSHHEVRWPARASGGIAGVLAPRAVDVEFWRDEGGETTAREIRAYRHDGSFEIPSDEFPDHVRRSLCERVNALCSKPDCRIITRGPRNDTDRAFTIGRACHIHAAAEGGPRYLQTQTPAERGSFANGIWLCAAAIVPSRGSCQIRCPIAWIHHGARHGARRAESGFRPTGLGG